MKEREETSEISAPHFTSQGGVMVERGRKPAPILGLRRVTRDMERGACKALALPQKMPNMLTLHSSDPEFLSFFAFYL